MSYTRYDAITSNVQHHEHEIGNQIKSCNQKNKKIITDIFHQKHPFTPQSSLKTRISDLVSYPKMFHMKYNLHRANIIHTFQKYYYINFQYSTHITFSMI